MSGVQDLSSFFAVRTHRRIGPLGEKMMPASVRASLTEPVLCAITVPAGSEVRMIYGGRHYYATIKNGRIVDEDREFSPSSWAAKITSTARNAWRDLWFKFPGSRDWVPAEMLRQRARRALQDGGESSDT